MEGSSTAVASGFRGNGHLRVRTMSGRAAVLIAPVVLALLLSWMSDPAGAGILDRIAEEGVMRAGTRASAAPFAQKTATGTFEGFSVDLLHEFRAAAEKTVGRPVRLELFEVTPADRLERVASQELDIVCGITTPTWDREELVDFSLPFFRDGTRVMMYRKQASRGLDLNQLTIGVVEGTTTIGILKNKIPAATLRFYADMEQAMRGLETEEVHGLANVGVVLLGLAARAEPRRSVLLMPRAAFLAAEFLACVLPQDDSPWRDFINRNLVGMFAHEGDSGGRYLEIYDRWFGRDSAVFYPLDRSSRNYLRDVSIWSY